MGAMDAPEYGIGEQQMMPAYNKQTPNSDHYSQPYPQIIDYTSQPAESNQIQQNPRLKVDISNNSGNYGAAA